MRLLRSVLGRRQFLVGSMTSASALALAKLGKAGETGIPPGGSADAADGSLESEAAGAPAAVRYPHLLSPLKVGNVVLRSRMYSTNALPHYLQGPENFCSEAVRSYYANLAKSGAAIVTCRVSMENSTPRPKRHGDSAHMAIYDNGDYGVQNYLDQLAEGIHCYGAKASFAVRVSAPEDYVSPNSPPADPSLNSADRWLLEATGGAAPARTRPGEEMPVEMLEKVIEDTVTRIRFFQSHGFDMVCLANTLSTDMRNRTDKYGGSMENSGRFALELYQAIKKACGPDFLIEALIAVKEPSIPEEKPSDYTLEEAVDLAKQWEDSVDMLHIRVSGGMANHPTGFNSEKNRPHSLRFAEAIRKSGAKVLVAPNGGFQDPSFNDAVIAAGRADMIAMGHAWITDWEYGKKVYEGRGDDVTPCIMCNKCHGLSTSKQWYSVCSVNPKMGIGPVVRLIDPPGAPKKVAVIGGGPAGMKAALTAAERGHNVTLYEGSDTLGGQMLHSDISPIKWPLREYKDYLIGQVEKAGIAVQLRTLATPEMIRAKGYDVVMAATGAQPVIPDIPGVKGGNVVSHVEVYGLEKRLGSDIVILNGGDTEDEGEEAQIGIETGIFLAQAGHKVTVLTSRRELLRPYRVHYPEQIISLYKRLENFSYITEATVTAISEGSVSYTDAGGSPKTIGADAVVISVGRQPRRETALKFSDTAGRFFTIGDCNAPGSVQTSIRSAFFAASQI